MLIVFSSVLCGYDTPDSMTEFAQLKQSWLQKYVTLDSIPCAETLRSFIVSINPNELIKGFEAFVAEMSVSANDVISIDGKTMRGTRHGAFDAMHIVSAWSQSRGITVCALASKDKSNEIKTIPQVLDLIDIRDAVVTIDAMGCQRDIAEKIRAQGGDYVLQVKGNQGNLSREIAAYYHKTEREGFDGIEHAFHEEIDKGHGRLEQRRTHHVALTEWVSSAADWKDARSIIRIERVREVAGEETTHIAWYVSSLAIDAKKAADCVRSHWAVENNLHWQLDLTYREDDCRLASAALTMGIIKRFCLNLLKINDTSKRRMKHRVMAAAIDDDYRTKILLSG